ncbi:MAG TPA: hypothetical protein VNP98_17335 [Chthoniobacterales bacterium]|nr:hypothetical protein [Chthoniobacterales bacterium]
MNPVAKTILGSVARHWLGALLAIVGIRFGISDDTTKTAVSQLTDDMVANAVVAFLAALLPIIASVWSRLMLLLRARLALLMHAGMTEKEVKNVIAEAPKGARIAAILTANPLKL